MGVGKQQQKKNMRIISASQDQMVQNAGAYQGLHFL